MIWLLAGLAQAADLEQVRIFIGDDHARVLLLTDAPVNGASARTTPAKNGVPARGTVLLPETTLDNALMQAYARDGDRFTIPVGDGGVERVVLADLEGNVQVGVEMTASRELTVTPVGSSGLLLDLKAPGAIPDSSLPDAEMLEAWIDGVSLARKGEGVSKERRIVVIDAGHGGHDPGASGCTGTHEADIALQLSKKVAKELEKRLDVEVVLTRDTDVFIPLGDRAAIANAVDADLFVSIHANAAPGPTAWGITTFYMDTASDSGAARVARRENALVAESEMPMDALIAELSVAGTNRLSGDLAALVQTNVITELQGVYGEEQIRDLGVQTALFYVLVSTRMPAILYEASFLTHPEDEMRLRQPLFQEMSATGIVDGIEAYFQAQDQGG
ncbi:MAG: N-acetylmuramoyl-L-alanine amidase [Proteobacteria bacterium]|nr:N-acetylmuramoyl-L-alanine amidase [Pseudomonadota bacterium]MCP4917954.1 N-acetylmuramoyl-L-alanine amidase [Pseudomonadota bacterium]